MTKIQKKKTTYNFQSHLNEIRLSESQKILSDSILQNTITFCTGPAGTSKTFTTMYSALKLLSKGEIKKIILTKPIQESGEKLGYLPGDIDEKIAPYLESYMLTLQKIIPEELVKNLFEFNIIEFRPLAYMRGSSFDNCLVEGETIFTEDGEVNVEDIFNRIQHGQYTNVWSFNFDTETIELKILDGMSKAQTDSYFEIEIDDKTLKVSPGHKFYTQRGWTRADELNENDSIFFNELQNTLNTFKKIKSIKKVDEKVTIYSPNVQDNHNYFSTGKFLSKNCLMILDEAQNTVESQLILYLTRMGDGSKIIVTGDTNQIDIKQQYSAFSSFIKMIEDVDGVYYHEFKRSDIVRHKMLIEITDRYEKWKIENGK